MRTQPSGDLKQQFDPDKVISIADPKSQPSNSIMNNCRQTMPEERLSLVVLRE